MEYYHNPRCSKSREGLSFLNEKNIYPEVIEYIKHPLSEDKIKSILKLLKINAIDLIRKNESIYKENIKDKDLDENQLIIWMVKEPKLIERPIFVVKDKAVIGRPKFKLLEII